MNIARNINFSSASISVNTSLSITFGISRPEAFYKKGAFRNFAKFTGKHLCQSHFFNKVAGLGQDRMLLLSGYNKELVQLTPKC